VVFGPWWLILSGTCPVARNNYRSWLRGGGHAVKQRAVFLTDLAITYVHDGEVDKGAEVAAEAADVLSRAGYATSVERLHEFRGLVQPWQDRTSVKELDERLALV
jgi:hypothetical protein